MDFNNDYILLDFQVLGIRKTKQNNKKGGLVC